MARQVVSRSQRRMEKRQALILLVLVLAVSLVSFTLGVMVGRSGSPTEAATNVAEAPKRVPVQRGDLPAKDKETPSQTREKLTFYDSLPKGEPSPLGSGINLPPGKTEKKEKASPEAVVQKQQEPTAAAQETPRPAKAESPPAAAGAGSYAVQVASFRGAEDARKLQERLAGKNYAAFVESADLQEKGVWHRVFVGPFADADGAGKVVVRLQAEEKLDGLIRKR